MPSDKETERDGVTVTTADGDEVRVVVRRIVREFEKDRCCESEIEKVGDTVNDSDPVTSTLSELDMVVSEENVFDSFAYR